MKPTADRFRCGDGWLVLAVLTDRQFGSLLRTLDRAEAIEDPRDRDWFTRLEHAAALRELSRPGRHSGSRTATAASTGRWPSQACTMTRYWPGSATTPRRSPTFAKPR